MTAQGATGVFTVAVPFSLPRHGPPTLIAVVDTEEEFDWSAPFNPAATSTENIRHQPLAQAIFDRHGLVPTYVIDYPVAASPESCSILGNFLTSGRCEIGAHLHPWVNPPADGPVDAFHSYPGNLDPPLERAKLVALTECIADRFGRRPCIYKAGRYGIGAATANTLRELGYRIDASVVPHVNFSPDSGPDFTSMPARPFLTAEGILALPLSVHFAGLLAAFGPRLYPYLTGRLRSRLRLPGIAARLGLLERLTLSPEGHRLDEMVRQTRAALAQGERLFMLTYHSSSLLPGGAPYVRTPAARERFLSTLDRYISFFISACSGRPASLSAVAATLLGREDEAPAAVASGTGAYPSTSFSSPPKPGT
ncbi:MAG: polysaccharide deacetylase family protein [Acetobacteraceae bacterium]